jgi:enoyl-CoA hydratase/carnithine racemase
MTEPQPLCIYEKREPHIAIIRLNRPEKKNAISRDLYWALDECWQKAKADDDVWSIILTGTADAFCVGGDLKENLAFAKGEMKGPRSGPRGYSSLRPLQMHKPIIAAINGYAVGGGFSLALSCHIRYCVPASKFGCSEVRWSHMAAWPSYVCQLPTGWAYWFALSGQMIDADTAFRLGLVQKICEPEKLIDECVELATTINRNGRLIAAHTVEFIEDKLLYEIQGWEKGFEVHREFYAHLRQSKDYDEGSAAFSERRKPEFSQEYYDGKTKPPGVPDPVK